MKKNFLKVAALLIAAMLLVVSCSQEIAPKNDNLVNASVNIADTRTLSTTGELLESNSVTYEYKLTHQFTDIDTNSTVVGDSNDVWKPIPEGNMLGFVTQGLWLIEIQGKVGNNVVLYGKADHYFNNQNKIAKVFVNPTDGTGKVSISVKMQDLEDASSSKYQVKYALTEINATRESESKAMERTPLTSKENKNTSSYAINNLLVDAGYYRLTISVWGPKDGTSNTEQELLGGITKSIRVLSGSNINVTGSIEPMDFDKSEVNVVLIEPKGEIKKVDSSSPVTGQDIVIKVTDNTNISDLEYAGYSKIDNEQLEASGGNVYAVSYIWDENGSRVTTTSNEHKLHYDVPGPKTVSCAIVYKVKSFGVTYTYVSAENKSLILELVVNEAATQSSTSQD